ncbi:GDSL-type esterase/lipase family protein [Leifsonia shinshuensis]|uniref:Lysophospholipase L1-like esterase n=1 Tax=Leifsonia shinshuensis TaxID=150026 RepID=A0A853CPZ7_9MICO|nr:lysophospholipase L1-like esterase [Leifsonia shinshuensis]
MSDSRRRRASASSRAGRIVLVGAVLAVALAVQPVLPVLADGRADTHSAPVAVGASRVTARLTDVAASESAARMTAGVVTVSQRIPANGVAGNAVAADARGASGGSGAPAASAGVQDSGASAGPVSPAAATAPAGASSPTFNTSPTHQVVRMGAIGDSITAFTDRAGNPTPWSWVRTAVTGDIVDAGGYRHYGDSTAQILAGTTPLTADAVVVMAGTNDILDGSAPQPTAQTLANISAIVAKAGGRVHVLSALAPKDNGGAAATLALNAALADLAGRSGWVWVDPWTSLRAPDGRWVAGATLDGVHPTAASGAVAGEAIRTAVLRSLGGF